MRQFKNNKLDCSGDNTGRLSLLPGPVPVSLRRIKPFRVVQLRLAASLACHSSWGLQELWQGNP